MSGLVSICIPMYNAEKTIGKAVASILTQTYAGFELIVVDNCSTDNSVKIVEEFNDPRITIIQYNIHIPYAEGNWDRCFYHAKGEYMAIFHADDIYLPDIISRQVETFQNHLSVIGIFTLGNLINDDDEIIGEFKIPNDVKGNYPYTYQKLFNTFLSYSDFLPTPSAMLKRTVYQACSPFRHDEFKSASDLDMWLRAMKHGPIIILPEKLFNYRVSSLQGTNKMNRLRTRESDYFKVMDYHLAQNKVSENIRMSYELSRFGDQVLCQKNFLQQYFINLFFNPSLLYKKYKMYRYFKGFKK